MRIEINAGGFGGATINGFQSDFTSFVKKSENVIASFKAVKKEVTKVSGGVGDLQSGLNELQNRIDREERRKEAAETARQKAEEFAELAVRVDKQVAQLVNKNKEELYRKYPQLKPTSSGEKPFYREAWEWLCAVAEDVAEGVKDALKTFLGDIKDGWNWVCDSAKKLWNGLVAFYQEHKEIIDIIVKVVASVLIIVGAVAAIIATGGAGLAVLAPLLAALGLSASTAAAVSSVIVIASMVSTAIAAVMDVADLWMDIDHPVFNFFQITFNIVSFLSNITTGIGKIYNSVFKIDVDEGLKIAKIAAEKGTKEAVEEATKGGSTNPWYLKNIVPDGVENKFRGNKDFIQQIKYLFSPDDQNEGIVKGFKYIFKDMDGNKVQIKWHSLDFDALHEFGPFGGGSGWTAQINIGKKFITDGGDWVRIKNVVSDDIMRSIHIKLDGNPWWWIK